MTDEKQKKKRSPRGRKNQGNASLQADAGAGELAAGLPSQPSQDWRPPRDDLLPSSRSSSDDLQFTAQQPKRPAPKKKQDFPTREDSIKQLKKVMAESSADGKAIDLQQPALGVGSGKTLKNLPNARRKFGSTSDSDASASSWARSTATSNLHLPHLHWRDLVVESVGLSGKRTQILKGISGRLAPHRLTCVIGPSGAGKSTLMNVLSGRVAKTRGIHIQGKIAFDTVVMKYQDLRDRVAYVMQHDCLLHTETAREAIEFSASLRGVPRARLKAVSLLKQLGLQEVENTSVGSGQGSGGLSGGEKRRVAIGVEIVSEPSIVFLDEPTSGLDYFSAHRLVEQLREMRDRSGLTMFCRFF